MMKTCMNCGSQYQATHNRQMYCSNDCVRLARNRLETIRRNKIKHGENIKLCAWCKTPLDADVVQVHHKYCSESCKRNASKDRRDIRRPPKRKHLCWDCSNYIDGCTWSAYGIPVEGWQATQTPRIYRGKEIGFNYQVHKCPGYNPG